MTNQRVRDRVIRAEYDEFTVGSTTVGMVSDPLNEHAWLQSSVVTSVDR